jgi:hypothetical protein
MPRFAEGTNVSRVSTIDASLSYVRLNLGRLISLEQAREADTPVGGHVLELLRESREALELIEELLERRSAERSKREERELRGLREQ